MAQGGNDGVSVDILGNSMRGLQQEKICLEQRLNELRQKRRQTENMLEAVTCKYNHVSDTNNKMVETMKVAKHKVAQMQSQADSLEEINKTKQKKIDELNEKVEGANKEMVDETIEFESCLANMTDQFMAAKNHYNEDNLQEEISKVEGQKSTMEGEAMKYQGTLEALGKEMEDMKISRDIDSDWGLSRAEQVFVYQAFTEENKQLHQHLDQLSSQLEMYRKQVEECQPCT